METAGKMVTDFQHETSDFLHGMRHEQEGLTIEQEEMMQVWLVSLEKRGAFERPITTAMIESVRAARVGNSIDSGIADEECGRRVVVRLAQGVHDCRELLMLAKSFKEQREEDEYEWYANSDGRQIEALVSRL